MLGEYFSNSDPWLSFNDQDSRHTNYHYSAGKCDQGERKHPLLPGAKPPDSIEQEAKPPVQWKVVLTNGFNVS